MMKSQCAGWYSIGSAAKCSAVINWQYCCLQSLGFHHQIVVSAAAVAQFRHVDVIDLWFSGSRYIISGGAQCWRRLQLAVSRRRITSLSLPVDECRRPVATGTLARALGAEQSVEPVEERLEVGEWTLMVHVVLEGAAPERRPVVRRQRQVVADVSVHGQRDTQQQERPVRQWVRGEQPRRRRCADPDHRQFVRVQVLRHPATRTTYRDTHKKTIAHTHISHVYNYNVHTPPPSTNLDGVADPLKISFPMC